MNNDTVDAAEKSFGKTLASDLYNFAKSKAKSLDISGEKLLTYIEGISKAYNKIQIMGMNEKRNLTEIYVNLRMYTDARKAITLPIKRSHSNPLIGKADGSEKKDVSNNSDIDSAIEAMGYGHVLSKWEVRQETKRQPRNFLNQPSGHDYKDSEQREDSINLVEKSDKLVILGQAGSGKTTLLKCLTLVYCGLFSSNYRVNNRIPLLIQLRDFNFNNFESDSEHFLGLIVKSVSQITRTNSPEEWIKKLLHEGSCIILVDGLDEVPISDVKNVIKSLRNFANKFSNNKFVVTCRAASYNYQLEGFKISEVDDFNNDDRKKFINQWFLNDAKTAELLFKDLQKSSSALDLCKTPLLASLVCRMYEYSRRIPDSRYELYSSCLDVMMYKWDSFRCIDRDKTVDSLSNNKKRFIVSNIARRSFDEGQKVFDKEYLLSMLGAEIKAITPVYGYVDSEGETARVIDPAMLLFDFEANMGIFVERAIGQYCFSHLTFQEFFTALSYIESNEVISLCEKAVVDPWYKEVFLLALERTYRPDEIGLMLAASIKREYFGTSELNKYPAELLEEVLNTDALFSLKIKQVLATMLSDLAFEQVSYSEYLEDDEVF